MIDSIESYFSEEIDSLKARIFDIEHGSDSNEEKLSISKPFFDELEEREIQLSRARNKIVVSIYSICEASLAGICDYYKIPLKFSLQNLSKRDYYLSDYLFSIGIDFTNERSASYIVYNAIRPLRNYLTHSEDNAKQATNIVKCLKSIGFCDIENNNNHIHLTKKDVLLAILNACVEMLIDCENNSISHKN